MIAASLVDGQAFAPIFERHYEAIARYARQRVGEATGEDIAAKTFTIAFANRERFDTSVRSARPWLYGIAANLIAITPGMSARISPLGGACRSSSRNPIRTRTSLAWTRSDCPRPERRALALPSGLRDAVAPRARRPHLRGDRHRARRAGGHREVPYNPSCPPVAPRTDHGRNGNRGMDDARPTRTTTSMDELEFDPAVLRRARGELLPPG